jgi:hypothetical protein
MPDAVEGRSCGGVPTSFSDEGAGSNSFDCDGKGCLGNAEGNSGGLRMSVMMVKVEDEDVDKDEGDSADHLLIHAPPSDSGRALRPKTSRTQRGFRSV